MKLEELEKYIDVKIINTNVDYRNNRTKIDNLDVGIKECTNEDFKNRGNDE